VLRGRRADDEDPGALVARWADRWDTGQRRAAAQLAELAAGEAHELAELVVAVRTLRGLRARG
jgi:glutamate dehydrogenase